MLIDLTLLTGRLYDASGEKVSFVVAVVVVPTVPSTPNKQTNKQTCSTSTYFSSSIDIDIIDDDDDDDDGMNSRFGTSYPVF